jgi:hypothetical protein
VTHARPASDNLFHRRANVLDVTPNGSDNSAQDALGRSWSALIKARSSSLGMADSEKEDDEMSVSDDLFDDMSRVSHI